MAQIVYQNQGHIRDQPISDDLTRVLIAAAEAAGVDTIIIGSGGQPATGTEGVDRTGSHRHDEGGAADISLQINGRTLDFNNPQDQAVFQSFVTAARANGATGIGAGNDYMGGQTIHVGFGTPAVWGAGGQSANAPGWLTQAYYASPDQTMAYAPTDGQTPAAQAANQMGQGGQGKQGKTGPVGTGRGRETPVIDALSRFKQARAQNKDWRTALGFALGRTDLEGNPLPPTPTARPENPANTTSGVPTPQPNPNRFLGSTEKAKTNEVPALPGVAAGGGPASPTKTAPQSMGLGGFAPALPSGTAFALPQGGAQQPPTAPASALPPLAYRGSVNPAGPNPGWGGGFTPNTADAPRSGVANTLVNQLGGASGPRYDFGAMSPAELRNVIRNGDLTAEETQQALEVLDLRHQQAEIGTVMNPVVQEQTVATPQFDSPTPGMQGRYMSGNAATLAEQLGGGANNPQSDNYIAGPFTPAINPGPMSGDASQLIAQLGGSSGPMAKAAPSAARMADLLMAPNPNAANPAYQQALIRALGA